MLNETFSVIFKHRAIGKNSTIATIAKYEANRGQKLTNFVFFSHFHKVNQKLESPKRDNHYSWLRSSIFDFRCKSCSLMLISWVWNAAAWAIAAAALTFWWNPIFRLKFHSLESIAWRTLCVLLQSEPIRDECAHHVTLVQPIKSEKLPKTTTEEQS